MNIIAEKLRQAYHNDLTDVPILLDGADEIDRLRERIDWFEGELAKADEWKAHNRALQEEIEQIKRRMEGIANTALAKEAGQ